MVGPAQREQFAQGGLIHLDDLDTGGFQISDLITECQTHLVGGVAQGLIIADKAPRQYRDRAREHALHGLAGQ